MFRIIIKDIEELNQKQQQIIELQKKIEELNEVKTLKQIQQQEIELNNRIRELSTYDSGLIGNIIAKLMTEFEGILYQCIKQNYWLGDFGPYNYSIEPKSKDRDILWVHPSYELKKINTKADYKKERVSLTFLPPSGFISNCISKKESKDINNSYIQYFINFLYDRRSTNSLHKITNEELEIVLEEFLSISKDLRRQRKEEIIREIKERMQYKKRLEFEKSCLIDRKLIYNSLSYIINNYEDNMTATQEYEEEWKRTSQWTELYGYHKLIIRNGHREISFKTEIDHDGCYPDEEYCGGLYVNFKRNTNICFFDLKEDIISIIKNSMYVETFMSMIENLYNENMSISLDDIEYLLSIISNDRKEKKRVLKKEGENY